MGGMGGSTANGSPFVVSQFHHYLAVGLLWVLIVAVVATFATSWWRQRRPFPIAEMSGRTWLRFSFGALWIFDGILQSRRFQITIGFSRFGRNQFNHLAENFRLLSVSFFLLSFDF